MKLLLAFLSLMCCAHAQHHEAPKQLNSFKSCLDTQTYLKVISDPICIPAGTMTWCAYSACNLSCPYSCVAGTCIAGAALWWATDADTLQYNYYSVKALAAIKNGLVTAFPCITSCPCQTIKKKTE